MIPFQQDYLQIMILLTLIAAGNTAFPIFLRLVMCVHFFPPFQRG